MPPHGQEGPPPHAQPRPAAYDDIFGQAPTLLQTLDAITSAPDAGRLRAAFASARPKQVVLFGCGSSYSVSLSVAAAMQRRLGIPCTAILSGDYIRHPAQYAPVLEGAVAIALSRSGRTTETVRAMRGARDRHEARLLAIDCAGAAESTPLRELADIALSLPWARDTGVCQTRAVSNLLMAGMALCALWAVDLALRQDLRAAVGAAAAFLEGPARSLRLPVGVDDVVLLADGELFGAAHEATLLFTEMARGRAAVHGTLDVRHGPAVRFGSATLVILLASQEAAQLEADVAAELRVTGSHWLPVSGGRSAPAGGAVFPADVCDAAFAVIAGLVPQVLALDMARSRGIDPDRPPGLRPWIALPGGASADATAPTGS